MQMSNTQLLGGLCLSPEVCRHPRLSVLGWYICLSRGANTPGRAGIRGCLVGHTHVGLCKGCATLSSARVCQRVKCAHISLPRTTGIVNPVYSQQQDGQGAA